jgi:hypothetical protein
VFRRILHGVEVFRHTHQTRKRTREGIEKEFEERVDLLRPHPTLRRILRLDEVVQGQHRLYRKHGGCGPNAQDPHLQSRKVTKTIMISLLVINTLAIGLHLNANRLLDAHPPLTHRILGHHDRAGTNALLRLVGNEA